MKFKTIVFTIAPKKYQKVNVKGVYGSYTENYKTLLRHKWRYTHYALVGQWQNDSSPKTDLQILQNFNKTPSNFFTISNVRLILKCIWKCKELQNS